MLTLSAELSGEYNISFVCPSQDGGAVLLGRARRLGVQSFAFDASEQGPELERFSHWLRAKRIAILNVHAGVGWEGIHAVRAARAAGVPVIVRTEHLPFVLTDPSQADDYIRMVRDLDRLLCVSDGVRKSHIRAGVPSELIHSVRNGVYPRTSFKDREAVRKDLGLPQDSTMILTMGRMTEQKGHRFLLRAAPLILARYPRACFIWAGDGPLEPELRRLAGELGIANSVRFAGRRPDADRLMASSDLFVLPSLFEGLPLVILEAMAAGIPVIGTSVCGTSETIVDGVCGRLVEAANPLALAGAILEALDQPQLAASWAKEACTRFAKEFQAARMARETAWHFSALLGSTSRTLRSRRADRVENLAIQG